MPLPLFSCTGVLALPAILLSYVPVPRGRAWRLENMSVSSSQRPVFRARQKLLRTKSCSLQLVLG